MLPAVDSSRIALFPSRLRLKMNTDQIKGHWKQLAGKATEKWGRLTDND
jgi:hypothetical protein